MSLFKKIKKHLNNLHELAGESATVSQVNKSERLINRIRQLELDLEQVNLNYESAVLASSKLRAENSNQARHIRDLQIKLDRIKQNVAPDEYIVTTPFD